MDEYNKDASGVNVSTPFVGKYVHLKLIYWIEDMMNICFVKTRRGSIIACN